jgi:hypothetical protein
MSDTDRTATLVAELAKLLRLPALARNEDGGFYLRVGRKADIYIYGGDEDMILILSPVAPLPKKPEYALMLYLLGSNSFDSDAWPFLVSVDRAGMVGFWGRVRIDDLTGASLADLIQRVADRTVKIRREIESGNPDPDSKPTNPTA